MTAASSRKPRVTVQAARHCPKRVLLSKPFGELDDHPPVGRILDFVECDDEAQALNDAQIDLIVPKQPQQFLLGRVGTVRAHPKLQRCAMVIREDDLKELAISLSAAIVKARQLSLPTSAYILSMALLEVSQALKAAQGDKEGDKDDTVR
jgi:hypothetical protein